MKSALLIAATMMGSSLAFAPNEPEINLARCGKGLELRGPDGKLLDGTDAGGHDFTGTGSTDNSDVWDSLVTTYGEGIKVACEQYNNALNRISNAMRVRGRGAEYWVNSPDGWAGHITSSLHAAGCGISEDDANIKDMVKTMTYIHQQKLRMSRATEQANEYMEKIQQLKNRWGDYRAELTEELNIKAGLLNGFLAESKRLENRNEFSAATEQLLAKTGSAAVEVSKLKAILSNKAQLFETLAHEIKRDSLRYSVLNQISNEGERLEIFARAIERAAYDVLSSCLVNYQKEAE